MSNETREIRALVPAAVAERLEHAAEVLGVPGRRLGGKALAAGLEQTVCELARHRAAELAAFLPPGNGRQSQDDAEAVSGGHLPPETTNGEMLDEAAKLHGSHPGRKPGRAEQAAAARAEELKEQRRRQRSPSKTPRDPVN